MLAAGSSMRNEISLQEAPTLLLYAGILVHIRAAKVVRRFRREREAVLSGSRGRFNPSVVRQFLISLNNTVGTGVAYGSMEFV